MLKKIIIFITGILLSMQIFAQTDNKIDSLKSLIQIPDNMSNIARYNELAWALRSLDPAESLTYSKKAIKLSKRYKDYVGLSRSYSYAGVAKRNEGYFVDALGYYKLGLETALKHKLGEQAGYAHINFGNWYVYTEDFEKAFNHLNIALNIARKIKNEKMIAYCVLNLGRAQLMIKNPAKALPFFKQALKIRTKLNDIEGKASCYKNIGDAYILKSKFKTAKQYLDSSLMVVNKDLDKDLLSEIYNKLAVVHSSFGKYNKAVAYADSSLIAAKITGNISIISLAYQTFSEIYKKKRNYGKSFEYLDLVRKYEKQLYEESMKGKVSNVKYEAEKKRTKIEFEKKKLQIKNQKLENRKKNTFLIGMVIIIMLILIIMTVLTKLNIDKKKANRKLEFQQVEIQEKNIELIAQNEEINAQKEEIQTQKELVEDQRDLISGKKDKIEAQKLLVEQQRDKITIQQELMKDSIRYARRIQRAMLTPKQYTDKLLPQNFILYLPRDIVSGDFYWYKQIDNKIIAIAGDCTGHGVPGAFVSMLLMSFLNDIINKQKIIKPDQVLEELRANIKKSLRQSLEANDSQDDGADMALCIIDKDTLEMEFAGANNPVFIIRNSELIIHKGTINPVGIYFREIPFKSVQIQLEKDDIIYMFSDGYTDQFGGKDNRRFMTARFKKLLLEIHKLPMKEQKDILEKALMEWQGNFKRVDDILITGIKIDF